jgi:hypothetical protein
MAGGASPHCLKSEQKVFIYANEPGKYLPKLIWPMRRADRLCRGWPTDGWRGGAMVVAGQRATTKR